jgi:hypothetical protein
MALGPTQVLAEGAVAIGIAPGGVINGYASGTATNYKTPEEARQGALAGCRKSTGANEASKAQCKVVSSFHNQCFSQALDPKDGTPGAGWALAATQTAADQEALVRCRETAGEARRSFCEVTDRKCDGSAK